MKDGDSDIELSILTSNRTWQFKFASKQEMESWKSCINSMIERLSRTGGRKSEGGTLVRFETNDELSSGEVTAGNDRAENSKSTEGSASSHRRPSYFRKESAISEMRTLNIICATWNLAESLPEMEHLGFVQKYRQADIVCFGVQECQTLMKRTTSGQISTTDVWESMLKASLGGSFTKMGSKVMGGIHMVLFNKKDISELLSNVTFGMVACGIGNVVYNKGAVGCSFNFKSTSFCIVNGHFQANRHRWNERNDDFWRIDSHMPGVLGKLEPHDAHPTPGIEAIKDSNFRRVSNVFGLVADSEDRSRSLICERFDHCFFMGDFNYRIEMDIHEIKQLLQYMEHYNPSVEKSNTSLEETRGVIGDKVIESDVGGNKELEIASALRMNMAMAQIQEEEEYDSDEAESKREDTQAEAALDDRQSGGDPERFVEETRSEDPSFAAETFEDFRRRTGLQSADEILERLLSLDQLNLHRAEGKVFIDFDEPKINFKPSYKFDPYTEIYDTGKKNRGAAWCDRVMYSKKNSNSIKVIDYDCVHGIYHSDHRAVFAEFAVGVLN